MHLQSDAHTSHYLKAQFEGEKRNLDEDMKLFFKLFEESTSGFEGSRAAARKMKKIAKRQTKNKQKFLLFHSVVFLVWTDSEMLSWPNSPLLVMLQVVSPNVLTPSQQGQSNFTPLHHLADLADYSDYVTHENQLILAKQLIEHGANVNTVSSPDVDGETPLHKACYW
jgi:hypothetical protein